MPRLVGLALAVVVLTSCGNDKEVGTGTPSPTTTPSPTPTSTLPSGVDQVVSFTIRNGAVVDARSRVKVKLGSTVRIVVTSDVADEVHVHGYDKTLILRAGRTVSLDVKATIPGTFEVELHHLKKVLTRLQVQ